MKRLILVIFILSFIGACTTSTNKLDNDSLIIDAEATNEAKLNSLQSTSEAKIASLQATNEAQSISVESTTEARLSLLEEKSNLTLKPPSKSQTQPTSTPKIANQFIESSTTPTVTPVIIFTTPTSTPIPTPIPKPIPTPTPIPTSTPPPTFEGSIEQNDGKLHVSFWDDFKDKNNIQIQATFINPNAKSWNFGFIFYSDLEAVNFESLTFSKGGYWRHTEFKKSRLEQSEQFILYAGEKHVPWNDAIGAKNEIKMIIFDGYGEIYINDVLSGGFYTYTKSLDDTRGYTGIIANLEPSIFNLDYGKIGYRYDFYDLQLSSLLFKPLITQDPVTIDKDIIYKDPKDCRIIVNESGLVQEWEKDLSYCNLWDQDFNGLDLSGTDFTGSLLSNTNFVNANLSDANFNNAIIRRTNFSGANLTNAYLVRLDLSSGIFVSSNLTGANLRSSYLVNSDLGGANMTDANLAGAWVNWRTKLENITWKNTICPGLYNSDDYPNLYNSDKILCLYDNVSSRLYDDGSIDPGLFGEKFREDWDWRAQPTPISIKKSDDSGITFTPTPQATPTPYGTATPTPLPPTAIPVAFDLMIETIPRELFSSISNICSMGLKSFTIVKEQHVRIPQDPFGKNECEEFLKFSEITFGLIDGGGDGANPFEQSMKITSPEIDDVITGRIDWGINEGYKDVIVLQNGYLLASQQYYESGVYSILMDFFSEGGGKVSFEYEVEVDLEN